MEDFLTTLVDPPVNQDICNPGKLFNCQCGDEFYEDVDNAQINNEVEEFVNNLSSRTFCQIIVHQTEVDSRLCNRLIKLHDIVASARKGNIDVVPIVRKNVKALLASLLMKVHHSDWICSVISSAFTNYHLQFKDILEEEFFKVLKIHPVKIPTNKLTKQGQRTFYKALIESCDSSEEVNAILQDSTLPGQMFENLVKTLLFSNSTFAHWKNYTTLVCYIAANHNALLVNVLKESMTLWSDPVIAKAYIYDEVIHYTKLSIFIFAHLSPEQALASQDMLIRLVGQGLPNHFSSTDPRSIQLAKFFCEVITESLKCHEKRSEGIPQAIYQPDHEINQDLLRCLHNCKISSVFWTNFHLDEFQMESTIASVGKMKIVRDDTMNLKAKDDDDDDDDDDDLEPIETLDAPVKCEIAYVRDFIEKFHEQKTFDEVNSTLCHLPNIVKFQLQHEHPQLSIDLVKMLVFWENDFDCPELEQMRKASLCNSLSAKIDVNAELLCSLFPQESTRVPQQLLILEVFSRVASQASLSDLQVLTKHAFKGLLQNHPDLFQSREVPVRIPLILFYHRLLSTMPTQMVTCDMVTSYLNSLTAMKDVDKALESTISYSLHHLVDRLRDVQLQTSDEAQKENLSSKLTDLRSWMWQLQHNPLGNVQNLSDAF